MAVNPLDILGCLNERLRDLIREGTPLRADLGFRDDFQHLVARTGFIPKILFEARPPFVQVDLEKLGGGDRGPHGRIQDLIRQSAEDEPWCRLRRPYRHQAEAFRAYRERGQSLVLATGTASGKTEAMALPILDAILRKREAGGAAQEGTRALFVFPLNALATDQAERLRGLAEPLGIRVGTMTGLTPKSEKDKHRARPPEVLITNFTMLEYMLLRPADKKLLGPALSFLALDEAHLYRGALGKDMGLLLRRLWLYLEQRGGMPDELTVYLASATFGGSEEDAREFAADLTGVSPQKVDVIRPTFDLGGVDRLPVEVQAVVEPVLRRLERLPGSQPWSQQAPPLVEIKEDKNHAPGDRPCLAEVRPALDRWLAAKEGEEPLRRWQLKVHGLAHGLGGLLVDVPPVGPGARAFGRMRQEEHLTEDARNEKAELEPVDEDGKPLFRLVACDRCGMPYLFGYVHEEPAKGIDRLFTQPPPQAEDCRVQSLFLAWPELAGAFGSQNELERVLLDPATREVKPFASGGKTLREFVVVKKKKDTASEAALLKECPACSARSARGSVTTDFVTDTEEATAVLAKGLLDSQVAVDAAGEDCEETLRWLFDRPHSEVTPPLPKLLTFSDTRRQAARFAPIITSHQLRRWILRRMWQALHHRSKEAQKEKLPEGLVLEKLVEDIVSGNQDYLRRFLEAVQLDREEPRPEKEVEFEILRLFAKRVRRSERGETCCLATVNPPRESPERWLRESNFRDPNVPRTLYLRLLDEARYGMFWEKGNLVEGDDGFPVGQSVKRRFAGLDGATGSGGETREGWYQWILGQEQEDREQETSLSRLVDLALRTGGAKGTKEDILKKLWECWIRDGVLTRASEGRGQDYGLNWRMLRFEIPRAFLRCSSCGYVGPEDRWMGEICTSCWSSGTRKTCDEYAPRTEDLFLFSAVEHTAQWGEKASKLIMRAFKRWEEGPEGQVRGPIHLLSSSTTYEVGVDLGDLSQVLLRNLPASGASLIQRIGRAGRRPGQSALSITYLRPFATDRVILLNPVRRLKLHPPKLKRDVLPIVRRHVRAAFLSWAIHECPGLDFLGEDEDLAQDHASGEDSRPPANITLAQFYVDGGHLERCKAPEAARGRLEEWLTSYEQRFRRDPFSLVLERVSGLPKEHYQGICKYLGEGLPEAERSVEAMRANLERSLREHRDAFEEECRLQYALVGDVMQALRGHDRDHALDVLRDQLAAPYAPPKTSGLWTRMVIPEWAKAGVIPGYAFPLHPVQLDVRSSRGRLLDLERDATLGVGEYVPGAEVTAGGRVYKSEGIQLATSPQRLGDGLETQWQVRLEVKWCIYCSRCGHLKTGGEREELLGDPAYAARICPGCGESLVMPPDYERPVMPKPKRKKPGDRGALGLDLHLFAVLKPRGFVTFDKGGKVFAKEKAVYPQPPQWLPQAAPSLQRSALRDWRVGYRLLEKERIAVLNLGPYGHRGFRLCPNTGLDLDVKLGKDKTTGGKPVRWFLGAKYEVPLVPIQDRVGLFTEFETEVLVLEPGDGLVWDEVTAWSLMTAFLVVAPDVLQAERREVGGLIYPRKLSAEAHQVQVVLYDNVHGGAGLMRELSKILDGKEGLLERAFELLDRCRCRLACPDCLKLAWNQRDHGKLDRLAARQWLEHSRRV